MSFIIACLWWLNAITAGDYSFAEIDARAAAHAAEIQQISADPALRGQVEAGTPFIAQHVGETIVTVGKPTSNE
jgi:hypothetical protein